MSAARAVVPKERQGKAYRQLWSVVSGAVADAFRMHPDYLTAKGNRSAATSVTKRVTGTVLGFAEQSAKGRVRPAEMEAPVATEPPPALCSGAEAGGSPQGLPLPNPHCRIGKVTPKQFSRYRQRDAFAATTARLRKELGLA